MPIATRIQSPLPEESTQDGEPILTVTVLTDRIKDLLEGEIPPVWVEGEISNYKRAPSDHLYFTLKDAGAQIQAVMFKFAAQALRFEPENGMKVHAHGQVTVYPPRGQYQMKITRLKPAGIGELQLRFEQLKKTLDAEGLFARERKRPIPFLPRAIGIVTSPTGAAIRDMLNILARRFPGIPVVLCPVKVQGDGSAAEIAGGIERLNALEAPLDVLIVGRGGGSIEDLWSFNEEVVARAIHGSRIPVVSAVGHEIDFTIADFVADLRAPTPSAAAELVVPERAMLVGQVGSLLGRLSSSLSRRAQVVRTQVQRLEDRLGRRPREIVEQRGQYLDDLLARITRCARHLVTLKAEKLRSALNRLEPLSPYRTLERGYALVTAEGSTAPVLSARTLKRGAKVVVTFAQGQALCQVLVVGDEIKRDGGSQGTLPGLS